MKHTLALGGLLTALSLALTGITASPATAKASAPKTPSVSASYCLPEFTSNVSGDNALQVVVNGNRVDKLVIKLKGSKGKVLRTSKQPVPLQYRKPGGTRIKSTTVFQGVKPTSVKTIQVSGSRLVAKSKKGKTRVTTTRTYKVKSLFQCKA